MKDQRWGAVMLVVVISGLAWLIVGECGAAGAALAAGRAEQEQWRADHTASRETWDRCRSVCGDAAALLPMGDGASWVTCSCVPTYAKPVPSPGPK